MTAKMMRMKTKMQTRTKTSHSSRNFGCSLALREVRPRPFLCTRKCQIDYSTMISYEMLTSEDKGAGKGKGRSPASCCRSRSGFFHGRFVDSSTVALRSSAA